MDDTRFWQIVDELGGVADDDSVERVAGALDPDEAAALAVRAQELATALLQRCRVPEGHEGDTAEWIAAAVVARGRETYEATRAAGGTLDPDAWDWEQAESLLVAWDDQGDDDGLDDAEDFVLQWLAREPPAGVVSAYDPELPDPGDDPAWGHVPATDTAWDAAREALLADPWVAGARRTIGERFGAPYDAVAVWLTLRETVTEPEITLWPTGDDDAPDPGEVVVHGVLPARDLGALDGEARTAAYLELVGGLLQAVLDS